MTRLLLPTVSFPMLSLPMLLLLCCHAKEEEVASAPSSPYESLDAPRLLRRMSLDLRGILPDVESLDAVEADPTLLDGYRDAYMEDPLYAERLVSLFSEQWHTTIDVFDVDYYDFGLPSTDEYAFERSVGEEPLRLLAYVASHDLPWSEIVTADYTLANPLLAEIWPLDYPEGGTDWEVSHYNDRRPPAGVLASNGLWWRYSTSSFNQNRRRVAAIYKLLVCEDLLGRPVVLGAPDSSSAAVDNATRITSDPYCLACHATIEPVATALFGFHWIRQYSPAEMVSYHPEREQMGPTMTKVEASWSGIPVYGLEDLGVQIAADSRFASCAAETMATALWRRPPGLADRDRLLSLTSTFEAGDQRIAPLVRAITDSPEYRAGSLKDGTDAETLDREMTVRQLSPDQLRDTLEELSGWSWTWGGNDQYRNDAAGYRVLAGGVDGEHVLSPEPGPTLTRTMVLRRIAQAAAHLAVQNDLVNGGERKLLKTVTVDSVPGDAAFTLELSDLYWRLLAIRPAEAELTSLNELWSSIAARSGPEAAWVGVVSALLQDPAFVTE